MSIASAVVAIPNAVIDALTSAPTAVPAPFPATNVDRNDAGPANAQTPATNDSRVIPPPSDTAGARVVQPVNEQAAADAQVSRRATAIALAERNFGELAAVREMRARSLDLSPAAAAEVIIASRATLENVVRTMFDRSPAQDQIATDLVRIIEHVGHDRRGEVLASETAALILDALARGVDEYRLSTFALGIRFGTGLTLPLAIADELKRRGDRRRRELLLLAMSQGLRGLGQRIAAAVAALIDLTHPLAGCLSGEHRSDTGDLVDEEGELADVRGLLQQHTAASPTLLAAFGDALRSVDTVGHDAHFALDALAKRHELPVELVSCRLDLIASQATAFSIGQSVSAHDAAFHSNDAGERNQHPEQMPIVTLERAERTYRSLGFAPSRSALLARAAIAWESAVSLDARWVVREWCGDPVHHGRLFEALLQFVAAAPRERRLRAIELSDIDNDLDADLDNDLDDNLATGPLWGLTLFQSLQEPSDGLASSQRIDSISHSWR
jgi:hypothetical protein